MADNNSILEKLDGLVARFEEVSTLITDPAVIADQKRYVKLTKEYKELDDLMKARKEYMQLLANIEEAKDILSNESDADMREMAKEEMDNSRSVSLYWKRKSNYYWYRPTLGMVRMPFLKYVAVQVVMKLRSSQATFSGCTPNSVKRKVGKWKYPVPMKVLPADIRRSFAALQAIMYTVH